MAPEFVRRGRELNARGAHLEAVKVCRLGLLAHPSELEGRLILGAALLALGRFDEVLAEMRVALELDGLNGTAMTLKGEALLGRGDHRQALDVLERAERYDAANPRVEELIAQAREGVATGGPPGLGDEDTSLSWTKNYPGFRPSSEATLDPSIDPDSESRTTLPGDASTQIDPVDLYNTGEPSVGHTTEIDPDAGLSTMEIDPEIEGVEIRPTDIHVAGDDVGFGGPTVEDVSGAMELSSSDLIPADSVEPPKATDDVRGFDDPFGSSQSDPTHGYRGKPEAYQPPAGPDEAPLDFEAPLFLDSDPDRPKSMSFPTDMPRPLPPPRGPEPAPAE